MLDMKRREFITLLGPCVAGASRRYRVRRPISLPYLPAAPSRRDAGMSNLFARQPCRAKCGSAMNTWCAASG